MAETEKKRKQPIIYRSYTQSLTHHIPPQTTTTNNISSVLEGGAGSGVAEPGAFLREAVEATFMRAVGLWARHTARPLGE